MSEGPTKIAILLPSLHGGGAERSMVDLARGLQSLGHRVELVLVQAEGPLLVQAKASLNVVDLGCRRVAFALPELVRYLHQNRPSVLLSCLNHTNILAAAALFFCRSAIRLILSIRNNPRYIRGRFFLPRRIIVQLARFFFSRADVVHAVSSGVADSAAEVFSLPREKIVVVYNPIVTPELLNLASRRLDVDRIGAHPNGYIVAAGRLVDQKDFITLVRAFVVVRRKIDVNLVILGEGPSRPEIEAEVRRLGLELSVRLPGFIDNPFPVFRDASLFVLSSKFEGLPGVLLQAMVLGIPVVSTDCPYGPSEILEGGKWGRLVPVSNPESLAEAIIEALVEREHPDVAIRALAFSREAATLGYSKILIPHKN